MASNPIISQFTGQTKKINNIKKKTKTKQTIPYINNA